mmetsp:Transcript_28495/g.95961  ORF Transcript_28495/g.95961 Transcript_28495/m.95961 type:complete len:229 (-) Transcript_28495:417-1103(-)
MLLDNNVHALGLLDEDAYRHARLAGGELDWRQHICSGLRLRRRLEEAVLELLRELFGKPAGHHEQPAEEELQLVEWQFDEVRALQFGPFGRDDVDKVGPVPRLERDEALWAFVGFTEKDVSKHRNLQPSPVRRLVLVLVLSLPRVFPRRRRGPADHVVVVGGQRLRHGASCAALQAGPPPRHGPGVRRRHAEIERRARRDTFDRGSRPPLGPGERRHGRVAGKCSLDA